MHVYRADMPMIWQPAASHQQDEAQSKDATNHRTYRTAGANWDQEEESKGTPTSCVPGL
jgi:hypothetical protein